MPLESAINLYIDVARLSQDSGVKQQYCYWKRCFYSRHLRGKLPPPPHLKIPLKIVSAMLKLQLKHCRCPHPTDFIFPLVSGCRIPTAVEPFHHPTGTLNRQSIAILKLPKTFSLVYHSTRFVCTPPGTFPRNLVYPTRTAEQRKIHPVLMDRISELR